MSRPKKPVESISLFNVLWRDQVHQEILNKVNLNRYDVRFMSNINNKYIKPKKPLSTKQNEVYEKLLHKYRKQLRRLGVRYQDILALEWEAGVLTLEDLKQKTFFRLVKKQDEPYMELFFPYSEERKQEMQSIIHDDDCTYLNLESKGKWSNPGRSYDFRWYPDDKMYRGPFNLYLFKSIYDWASKNDVCIDSYVEEIAAKYNQFGTASDWEPHIKIVHGRIIVSSITEGMYPHLENIDPTDTSAKNIERVCALGVAPPDEQADIADFLVADTMNGVTISSQGDLQRLYEYLRRVDRKAIWIYENRRFSPTSVASKLVGELKSSTVPLLENLNWDSPIIQLENARYSSDYVDQLKVALDTAAEKGYNTVIVNSPLEEVLRSQSFAGKIALAADKIIYLSVLEKNN